VKILPASQPFAPRGNHRRATGEAAPFALERELPARRPARSAATTVAMATPYVAQQIGQIVIEDEGLDRGAAVAAVGAYRAAGLHARHMNAPVSGQLAISA
jgi:hypothetical protein